MASFVFPAPPLVVDPGTKSGREVHLQMLSTGAFHAAGYFNVEAARVAQNRQGRSCLSLSFGPNGIWSSDKGWVGAASKFLNKTRKIGSRHVDVLAELDGTRDRPDGMPWE